MTYEFRLLDVAAYEGVAAGLDRIAAGDRSELERLVERATDALDGAPFRRWHDQDTYLRSLWLGELERLAQQSAWTQEDLVRLSRVVVPMLCMPDYQHSFGLGRARSPNLVILGNFDGDLYMAIRDADAWFDTFFVERFGGATERYPADDAMIRMATDEVERLLALTDRTHPVPGRQQAYADATRKRLRDLLQRAMAAPELAVVVSTKVD